MEIAEPIANPTTCYARFNELAKRLEERIIGQSTLINRLIVSLIADGHMLVEGAPGLAKTSAIKTLATLIEGTFQRIQFTPDLLPSDITGGDIYHPDTQTFHFMPGPLFHNLILADEINRAPAKVQSALLEAMAEKQITIGQKSHPLASFFFVMATQNALEHEGTYPLPEAQLDRFLFKVTLQFPDFAAEKAIMVLNRGQSSSAPVLGLLKITQAELAQARHQALKTHLAPALEDYIIHIVCATRNPTLYSKDLAGLIHSGASPRASLCFDRACRVLAWLDGRDFVTPGDIQSITHDVLRHRIVPSFAAQADNVSVDELINQLLHHVAVP